MQRRDEHEAEPVESSSSTRPEIARNGIDAPDDKGGHQAAQGRNDERLFEALVSENFDGPIWTQVTSELALYGYSFVLAWLRTGRIFDHCRRRGYPVGASPTTWTFDDQHDLATDTVLKALETFRAHALARTGWDSKGGASLATYFAGTCLLVFPAVYRPWKTRHDATRLTRSAGAASDLYLLGEPLAQQTAGPDDTALCKIAIADGLQGIPDERTRVAVIASAQGYTHAEIAQILSANSPTTANNVKQILFRHRQRIAKGATG